MNTEELAIKLCGKLEFMIMQYLPRPTCQSKHKAHAEMVEEVKRKIAGTISPQGNGITINITP